jgi:hypothetical protein
VVQNSNLGVFMGHPKNFQLFIPRLTDEPTNIFGDRFSGIS